MGQIITTLRKMHGKEAVGVTAATGLAASNLGGVTVNSWGGVGTGEDTIMKLIDTFCHFRKKASKKRWETTKALVLDEGE